MSDTCPLQFQKFIAYALIGYLDVIKRSGTGDFYFNCILGPPKVISQLESAGANKSVIELFYQVDELESLYRLSGEIAFDDSVKEVLSDVITFLREDSAYPDGSEIPILKLISVK